MFIWMATGMRIARIDVEKDKCAHVHAWNCARSPPKLQADTFAALSAHTTDWISGWMDGREQGGVVSVI